MTLPNTYVEESVVQECAMLLLDRCSQTSGTYIIRSEQIEELEAQVGSRIARLALRRAGFRPAQEGSFDWFFGRALDEETFIKVKPGEFWGALDALDPSDVLGLADELL
ncbi:hypothetical protein [Allosediminivita pacifica]|uniref:Uncharacterized protein n=1 Tax=Allosediminivita pacifica TaxID=1267769 RepID=A0A2T6B7A0_9RHOB|nr:hypothetical protein [Allosediminivita pacifica]PTX51961.1 hypothetical protein C8N44_1025 [Allosediminivita pacifica]GGA98320.1 hypothetical protein GCM10011324_05730 [Allosediminivita pacifica]